MYNKAQNLHGRQTVELQVNTKTTEGKKINYSLKPITTETERF